MRPELDDPRFGAWASGRFRERFGPAGKVAPRSQTKLCLVATDARFLIDLLYGLSLRPDCYYVKYGTVAREGMYLGRCFMQTDSAAGELCEALKHHPRVMVSLQDDASFGAFRKAPLEQGACGVWEDWPEHAAAIAEIHRRAFGRPDEARMVEAVRAEGQATVSLAAWLDGQPVGHVLLSPVTIDGSTEPRGLGLAPVAVLPEHQGRGIGRQLVETGLERARLLGHRYVVVLGHPEYYPRFGFAPASRYGLRYCEPVPDEAFMALELVIGCLERASGEVRYRPALSGEA